MRLAPTISLQHYSIGYYKDRARTILFVKNEVDMKKYEAISIPDRISVHAIVAVLKTKFIVSSEQKEKNGDGDTHDFPEILYVDRGRCRMRVSDEVYDLTGGDMIMYSPMARHSRVGDADADISIISFMADAVCLSPLFNRVIRLDPDRRDTLAKIVERGVSVYERRYSDSEIGGMVIRDGVGDFEVQKVKKGLELTVKAFADAMNKMGVTEIESKTFDPNLHNAVMHVEDEQYGEGEIVEVFQKGYAKGEKVIRYAMVKVAN